MEDTLERLGQTIQNALALRSPATCGERRADGSREGGGRRVCREVLRDDPAANSSTSSTLQRSTRVAREAV